MKTFLVLFLCILPVLSKPKGGRMIGGTEAFAGEFIYAAAIYKTTADGNYFCTGSLLNTLWILTAGQCVEGAVSFTILVGTHKLSGDQETVQKEATETYALHPDYNPLTLENDIGLIRFRISISYNAYTGNLHLPPVDISGAGGRVFGWGQTPDEDRTLSDTLRYLTLEHVSADECRLTYGAQLKQNMVCYAGNYNEGTCFGDSGSPMIQVYTATYTAVKAIASFFSSNGCESTDPSGFTNVYPYNNWINSVMSSTPME